jgi:Clostripain family
MTEKNSQAESEGEDLGYRPTLDWTIMVYLAGDNNLSANSISILQDLEDATTSSSQVRVLACYDSNTPFPKGARYLEVKHRRYGGHHPWDWGLHNDLAYPEGHLVVTPDFCNEQPQTVQSITEPVAAEGLARFLKWALRTHPAKHYMLILFGHGILVSGNTFLVDSTPPSFLRLKDFSRIIRRYFGTTEEHQKPHLDILACDNCVMNGIEAAYEIQDHVDYMIGSQDLMLTVGWPFKKIIEVVQDDPTAPRKKIVRRILKACARRLLDYSLMERSSEQAVVDLTKLRDQRLTGYIKELAAALKEGLKTDNCGHVCYREIRDAVRLARLEAQAYWDETFVDLYDFCELLLWKCNDYLSVHVDSLSSFTRSHPPTPDLNDNQVKDWLTRCGPGDTFRRIAEACAKILYEFKQRGSREVEERGIVPYAYYVCPDLQYSHGLSIYFPWTMPSDPIIFDPKRRYGEYPPKDYEVKTAFDEYKTYKFATEQGADWASFLVQFFKATLRNVRLVDYRYDIRPSTLPKVFYSHEALSAERLAPATAPADVDLQKSSPDTGEQDDSFRGFRIKNYPRRFYLSPEDCKHRHGSCDPQPSWDCRNPQVGTPPEIYRRYRVSYLGWQIRGLLAEVIAWPKERTTEANSDNASPSANSDQ